MQELDMVTGVRLGRRLKWPLISPRCVDVPKIKTWLNIARREVSISYVLSHSTDPSFIWQVLKFKHESHWDYVKTVLERYGAFIQPPWSFDLPSLQRSQPPMGDSERGKNSPRSLFVKACEVAGSESNLKDLTSIVDRDRFIGRGGHGEVYRGKWKN
jgi:hypothetical protein